ncbi:hypothetical protein HanIR_Chr09g0428001 [Helianthus annuus]|nr:hypothetical protein HanIR_Chr09g0428001 [Helianthus annuus]
MAPRASTSMESLTDGCDTGDLIDFSPSHLSFSSMIVRSMRQIQHTLSLANSQTPPHEGHTHPMNNPFSYVEDAHVI